MDISPPRRRNDEKLHSARRLFVSDEHEKSARKQSDGGQACRRLILTPEDEDAKPNVVAQLMGLDPAPESSSKSQQSTEIKQLHELLRIKEPFLLKELLVEEQAEEHHRKHSFMEKFTGLVKRNQKREEQHKVVLSPRRNLNANAACKSSPIKSPRGLMLEAAVRIIDVDPKQKNKGKKKLSLSRSSSEPCLGSSSKNSKNGFAKLSENVGRELSKRFGSGSKNLVRSKSDLGLQKPKKQLDQEKIKLKQQPNLHQNFNHKKNGEFSAFSYDKFSHNGGGLTKLDQVKKKNSGILSYTNRLFSRKHVRNTDTNTNTNTNTSASLVKSLLRRRSSSNLTGRVGRQDALQKSSSSFQFCDECSDRSEGSSSPPSTTSSSTSDTCEYKSGQPSPVSILEAPFVDDVHTSSGDDSPDADSQPSTSSDNVMDAILNISRIRCIDLSSIGIASTTSPFLATVEHDSSYIAEILQLTSGGSWPSIRPEVFDTLENKLRPSFKDSSVHARKLVFHCVEEVLSSLRERAAYSYGHTGYSSTVERVHGQIKAWSSLISCTTDELVEKDMSVGKGKWRDFDDEIDGIVGDVERGLMGKMVEELAWELCGLASVDHG